MSEELEDKYLAVLQQSFSAIILSATFLFMAVKERSELRKENEILKEKLANISYQKDCELFTKKFNSSDFVVNEQNTKESELESDKYYIFDLDSCEYLVENTNSYTLDKDKATIFSYQRALFIASRSGKNFVYQRVNETK